MDTRQWPSNMISATLIKADEYQKSTQKARLVLAWECSGKAYGGSDREVSPEQWGRRRQGVLGRGTVTYKDQETEKAPCLQSNAMAGGQGVGK